MKLIHLVIPMSGEGARFQSAGYALPKPLVPINGVPMIEKVLESFPHRWPTQFVLSKIHLDTDLSIVLRKLRTNAAQTVIAPHKLGPSHAIALALDEIPEDAPVLVSYCDYGMVWDSSRFEAFVKDTDCDACVISYRGFHPHYLSQMKYAYSKLEMGQVVEVREKESFTDNRENEFASSGGYYFKNAKLLKEAILAQINLNLHLNGEYYTSLTVQALLEANANVKVNVFEIFGFFQWGTPEDIQNYEYWDRCFKNYNKFRIQSTSVEQSLMPMAGKGSRFDGISSLPKPLIPIFGNPMFIRAQKSLPRAELEVFVCLAEFAESLKLHVSIDARLKTLSSTPSGQALSTELGAELLNPKKEVMVTACDHAIVMDPERWEEFSKQHDADAVIFTIRGYPGALRSPNSYTYVVPEKSQEKYPVIKNVSVKAPISNSPKNDHLLVGTFWFRSAELLIKGINLAKNAKVDVNNELYLDSVFDLLIEAGHSVRIFELDGYIGWGDPQSLSEALYWQEMFCGSRASIRGPYPGVVD
ncbi:MAG: NTP transferase domain-containing protein [Bdellovibrionales bacterium]|nr:NTP transferase domain-containing protein [Bdellovibrionales bacterium]